MPWGLTDELPGELFRPGQQSWGKPLSILHYCGKGPLWAQRPYPSTVKLNASPASNKTATLVPWLPRSPVPHMTLQICLLQSNLRNPKEHFSLSLCSQHHRHLPFFPSLHDLMVIYFPICFLHQPGAFLKGRNSRALLISVYPGLNPGPDTEEIGFPYVFD